MLHFPNPSPPPSKVLMKPKRSDSLRGFRGGSGSGSGGSDESTLLASLAEELHDIQRVHDFGQEEDLKSALGKMLSRVKELVCVSSV